MENLDYWLALSEYLENTYKGKSFLLKLQVYGIYICQVQYSSTSVFHAFWKCKLVIWFVYKRNIGLKWVDKDVRVHARVPCHAETSPLICRISQWTGFYMIETSAMKELMIVIKISIVITAWKVSKYAVFSGS